MKKLALIAGAISMIAGVQAAQAAVTTYNVVETFYEPDTQPKDTIFTGSFTFDDATQTVSSLSGYLTESMTGTGVGDMTQLHLTYQLSSVYDAGLGGLLVTAFLNSSTATFYTTGSDNWSPAQGVAMGGTYNGFPVAGSNPGNAYAMIFVNTTDPTAALTTAQINKLAYADCAPGGMMGATCMTGTTVAGYGSFGTMSGYPVSQMITAAPVPEPETYGMLMAGLGLVGFAVRKRKA